jgi:hypothetical protein
MDFCTARDISSFFNPDDCASSASETVVLSPPAANRYSPVGRTGPVTTLKA